MYDMQTDFYPPFSIFEFFYLPGAVGQPLMLSPACLSYHYNIMQQGMHARCYDI